MLRINHRKSLALLLGTVVFAMACHRKTSSPAPANETVRYEYELSTATRSDWYASVKDMREIWHKWEEQEISDKEWLRQLNSYLAQSDTADGGYDCFVKEYTIFPTLDKLLLPKFIDTGDVLYQEAIISYLVKLDQCRSLQEIELQARSLLAISSGGNTYPGLNERMIQRLQSCATSQKGTERHKDIQQLLTTIKNL